MNVFVASRWISQYTIYKDFKAVNGMPKETVGHLIRKERKRQGLTMEQLGKKIGISGSLVGRYERGEENPKIETVERFANALGVLIPDLYPEWFFAEEVRKFEHSQSSSFQARMLRAIVDLDDHVTVWSYLNQTTTEQDNEYAEKILPEIAKKYDVSVEDLKKYRLVYSDSTESEEFGLYADLSEPEQRILHLFNTLNEKGQKAAYRHLQELNEIPKYCADKPKEATASAGDKKD